MAGEHLATGNCQIVQKACAIIRFYLLDCLGNFDGMYVK